MTTPVDDLSKLADAELAEEWERAHEVGTDQEIYAVVREEGRREGLRQLTDAQVIEAWESAAAAHDDARMDVASDEMERRGLDC